MGLVNLDVEQLLDETRIAHLRRVAEQASSDLSVENRHRHRAGQLVNNFDILPGRMHDPVVRQHLFPERVLRMPR